MRIKNKNNANRTVRSLLAVAAALIAAVCAIIFLRDMSAHPVHAETEGTVTIHVYDPAEEYSKLVGWIWINGVSGDGIDVDAKAAPATEEYKKGDNVAHVITVTFPASRIEHLKNGKKLGFLICIRKGTTGSWNDKFDKEGLPDVYVDLSGKFDANNHADIYFVRKDNEAFTNIEDGKMALEKITSAKFTASKKGVAFETSSIVKKNAKVTLYCDDKEVASVKVSGGKLTGTATFSSFTLDVTADYTVGIDGFSKKVAVSKVNLIDDVDFIKAFESAETQNTELGAIYTPEETTFRIWAPFATKVSVKLYNSGTGGESRRDISLSKYVPKGKKWGGIWEGKGIGDYNKMYYTYFLVNNGSEIETIDPYAKACGANGERGMIVDLRSTDPAGWSEDTHLYKSNPSAADNPIVWEIQIKDFSSSADSGMKYKGKYLAFTEQDTHVPGDTTLKTGLSYLKDLGITYIHLNPVYDFATVDETDMSVADDTKDNFNWGYDPQNYNIPEGSYSTDPSNGEVRINEFKQMVQALHSAGIGVIMDVVYNHTYSVIGQALNNAVPGYWHRTDKNGKLTDGSGCGNETASERTMYRKYIVESILYWATEYHIDGFRFDLMGLHDMVTIKAVRDALDELDNKNGSKLLMYGEPWGGFGVSETYSFQQRRKATKSLNQGKYTKNSYKYGSTEGDNTILGPSFNDNTKHLPWNVAVFNDSGRDGIRGNVWDGLPSESKGWLTGDLSSIGRVKKMTEGGAADGPGLYTGAGSRNVAYASAHDNFTLWDQLVGKRNNTASINAYDYPDTERIKKMKLASAAYLMSTGITFILAGDEFARTKYGNENSYNTPAKLNALNWTRQKTFKTLVDHYKKVIGIRRECGDALFSYSKSKSVDYCKYSDWYGDGSSDANGETNFGRTQGGKTITCRLTGSNLSGMIAVSGGTPYNF